MLSSDFHVKPKKFRLFFIVLLALLLGVIWGGTYYAMRLVRQNLESSMRSSMMGRSPEMASCQRADCSASPCNMVFDEARKRESA